MKILSIIFLTSLLVGCSQKIKLKKIEYASFIRKVERLEEKLNLDYNNLPVEGKKFSIPKFKINKNEDNFFRFKYLENGGEGSFYAFTYGTIQRKKWGVKICIISRNSGTFFFTRDKKRDRYWLELLKKVSMTEENKVKEIEFIEK